MSTKKELKKKYGKEALVSEQDGFDIVIKWDAEARLNNLIKIVPHKGTKEIIISADLMTNTIIDNFSINHMYAMDTKVKQIDTIEVERTIKGVCEKDFKKGDEITFNYRHVLPLEYAIVEEAERLARISGEGVRTVTREELDKAALNIRDSVREFNEQANAEFLKRMKDKQQSESTNEDKSVESSVD